MSKKSDLLDITIVIPTKNRSKHIEPLLASLVVAENNYTGKSEIILIDDSDPEESEIIQSLSEKYNAKFVLGSSSVRQKRNLGTTTAQYPIILFVDSDCVATPNLLIQHALTYHNLSKNEDDVAGVVGVTNFIGPDSFMWKVITRTQYLNAFTFAKRMDYAPWATCSNTSYRRDVLLELGGFETNFPFRLGADDSDLGIRLNKAGYRLKCNPDAEVNHTRETWNSFSKVWKRAFRWGCMDVHLYFRRHTDRLIPGFPKFSNVFGGLFFIACIQMLLFWNPLHLIWPFLWAALYFFIMAIQTVILSKERWFYFFHELIADILGLTFELGTIIEGVHTGEWSVWFKAVQRGPIQGNIRKQFSFQPWAMWLAVLLLIFIQEIMTRCGYLTK